MSRATAWKKISMFTQRFEGVDWQAHVCVNCDGRFSIALPAKVIEKMDCSERVCADTKDAAIQEFTKAMLEYENTKFTTTKVIVYRFQCSMESEEKQIFRSDLGYGVELGMGLQWNTCTKYEHPGRHTQYKTDEGKNLSVDKYGRDNDHKEMLWTQEKEDFFKVLQASLENSIARAVKFFDGPVEQCILAHKGLGQLGFDSKEAK